MTEQELHQRRRLKWRLDGNGARTQEAASAFLDEVGFCLMYPQKTMPLLPTFIGAFVGGDESLPSVQTAFRDARAAEATELMVRLLRQREAYEAHLFGENDLLVAASVFPFLYALVGDRNPRQTPKPGARSEYSQLARDTFEVIRQRGPIPKQRLLNELGGEISGAALDHALRELWARLRITRVDYGSREGASWDALYRWSPEAVRAGINLSVGEGLSALLSKYLDCVVAAELSEIEEFFGHLVSRSRVRDAVNALLSAREFEFVPVGARSLVRMAPPRPARERRLKPA